jgi:hypothetical protein
MFNVQCIIVSGWDVLLASPLAGLIASTMNEAAAWKF